MNQLDIGPEWMQSIYQECTVYSTNQAS